MHPSIYREFEVRFFPSEEQGHQGVAAGELVLYAQLREKRTGENVAFKLRLADGVSPERWIEEQVRLRFPLTTAARELRKVYGLVPRQLKPNWRQSFGDRLYSVFQQANLPPSLRILGAYIAAMSPVLYSAMSNRAMAKLAELPQPANLQTLVTTLQGAWRAILTDGAQLSLPLHSMQCMALDVGGWNSRQLKAMTPLELAQLKEKAHFARLALATLSDEDWVRLLAPVLTPIS